MVAAMRIRGVLAAAVCALALSGCLGSGGGDEDREGSGGEANTVARDRFGSEQSRWTEADAGAAGTAIGGGGYDWALDSADGFTAYPSRIADQFEQLRDVTVRARGTSERGQATLAVFCRMQGGLGPGVERPKARVAFLISPGGAAEIREYGADGVVVSLARGVAPAAGPIRIEARCEGDRFTMLSGGRELASAQRADSLGPGYAGLEAIPSEESTSGANVRWSAFSLRRSD